MPVCTGVLVSLAEQEDASGPGPRARCPPAQALPLSGRRTNRQARVPAPVSSVHTALGTSYHQGDRKPVLPGERCSDFVYVHVLLLLTHVLKGHVVGAVLGGSVMEWGLE